MKTLKNTAAYLAAIPKDQRAAFKKLSYAIQAAAPKAKEVIFYGMPAFRYVGFPLVSLAPWKNHCSLYPGSGAVGALKAELKGYDVCKGTIRFPADKPVPASLVRKVAKGRMKENEARAKRKA